MSAPATQLTLRLSPQEVYRFDNFYFANAEIQRAFNDFYHLPKPDFLYLWGEAGVGKSHLLIACAEQAQKQDQEVVYLSFKELLKTATPEVLKSIELQTLVCLDDVGAIIGHRDWEEAVFHCFNRLKTAGSKLLLASTQNQGSLQFSLPDLASRFSTALIYQLANMTDEDKQQALIVQAQSKGLVLQEFVAQHLLRYHSRDMNTLMQVLQQLDSASLAEKRKLTIPFVRQVLGND